MTIRASDKYYILERLQSKYDKTESYIAEDLVSGQVIRLRYDPYDAHMGSIAIDDITMQVNGGSIGRGPFERYDIDDRYFVMSNSQGIKGVEYPIVLVDKDPAGFLYVRIYYDDRMVYQPGGSNRSYYGTLEFIEEVFPTAEDEELEEAEEAEEAEMPAFEKMFDATDDPRFNEMGGAN